MLTSACCHSIHRLDKTHPVQRSSIGEVTGRVEYWKRRCPLSVYLRHPRRVERAIALALDLPKAPRNLRGMCALADGAEVH